MPSTTTCAALAPSTGWPPALWHRQPSWAYPDYGLGCEGTNKEELCLFSRLGCGRGYVIRQGDTCDSISSANGLTVSDLQDLNPTLQCDALVPWQQVLCVAELAPGE
jgi:hypothetical protein